MPAGFHLALRLPPQKVPLRTERDANRAKQKADFSRHVRDGRSLEFLVQESLIGKYVVMDKPRVVNSSLMVKELELDAKRIEKEDQAQKSLVNLRNGAHVERQQLEEVY